MVTRIPTIISETRVQANPELTKAKQAIRELCLEQQTAEDRPVNTKARANAAEMSETLTRADKCGIIVPTVAEEASLGYRPSG